MDLTHELQNMKNPSCSQFEKAFVTVLDNHVPPNPLSAKITKWSNTLKQFVAKLPTNCLSVFDHFVGLALKGFKRNS